VLAPQRAVIRGRVDAADGTPLAHAFVFVHVGLEQPDKGVLADEHGRFELPVVAQGPVEVRARRTLHMSQWTGNFTRLDAQIGRKVLGADAGEARRTDVEPGAVDVVLTLAE
jgi:hypothetical protein